MSLDFCRGLHFCCFKRVICCQRLCVSSRFCPENKPLLLVDFWSLPSTSTKNQPTFWKKKMYITASSFKFSGFPCFFFLDDLQLRRFSCLSGVETWPFFGGVFEAWPGEGRWRSNIEHWKLRQGEIKQYKIYGIFVDILTWNLNMKVWFRWLSFSIPGFWGCYVNLQGCNFEGAFFGNTITTWRKGEMLVKCLLHSKPIKKVQDVGAIKQ